jgi:hypothetical protein
MERLGSWGHDEGLRDNLEHQKGSSGKKGNPSKLKQTDREFPKESSSKNWMTIRKGNDADRSPKEGTLYEVAAQHSEHCCQRVNSLRSRGAALRALLAESKHFTKWRRSIESIAGRELRINAAALRALLSYSYGLAAQH